MAGKVVLLLGAVCVLQGVVGFPFFNPFIRQWQDTMTEARDDMMTLQRNYWENVAKMGQLMNPFAPKPKPTRAATPQECEQIQKESLKKHTLEVAARTDNAVAPLIPALNAAKGVEDSQAALKDINSLGGETLHLVDEYLDSGNMPAFIGMVMESRGRVGKAAATFQADSAKVKTTNPQLARLLSTVSRQFTETLDFGQKGADVIIGNFRTCMAANGINIPAAQSPAPKKQTPQECEQIQKEALKKHTFVIAARTDNAVAPLIPALNAAKGVEDSQAALKDYNSLGGDTHHLVDEYLDSGNMPAFIDMIMESRGRVEKAAATFQADSAKVKTTNPQLAQLLSTVSRQFTETLDFGQKRADVIIGNFRTCMAANGINIPAAQPPAPKKQTPQECEQIQKEALKKHTLEVAARTDNAVAPLIPALNAAEGVEDSQAALKDINSLGGETLHLVDEYLDSGNMPAFIGMVMESRGRVGKAAATFQADSAKVKTTNPQLAQVLSTVSRQFTETLDFGQKGADVIIGNFQTCMASASQ